MFVSVEALQQAIEEFLAAWNSDPAGGGQYRLHTKASRNADVFSIGFCDASTNAASFRTGSWLESKLCQLGFDLLQIPNSNVTIGSRDGESLAIRAPSQPPDRTRLFRQGVK